MLATPFTSAAKARLDPDMFAMMIATCSA